MPVPVRVSVICSQNLPVDGGVIMPKPHKAHSFLAHPRSSIWKCTAVLFICNISFTPTSGEPVLLLLLGFSPPSSWLPLFWESPEDPSNPDLSPLQAPVCEEG